MDDKNVIVALSAIAQESRLRVLRLLMTARLAAWRLGRSPTNSALAAELLTGA